MRFPNVLLLALFALVASASPLFAAEGAGLGGGIGMGLSIVGIGIGIGLVGHSALSGIARQPEQAGAIQGAMFSGERTASAVLHHLSAQHDRSQQPQPRLDDDTSWR